MKKAGESRSEFTGIYTNAERELMLKLVMTGDTFNYAMDEKAPNYVCENAYQLAVSFSRFYHENHIMDEQDEAKKASWLALAKLTRKVIVKHLDILGITAVENM